MLKASHNKKNLFLKKLSQCCFLESFRRNAWINRCWWHCTFLTSLLRNKTKKLSEDNTKASQNFIVESWRSYLSVAFSKVSRRNAWINQCWCILLTSLLRKKKKLTGDNSKASQNFIAQSWRSNLFLEISRRNEWINNLWCVLLTNLLLHVAKHNSKINKSFWKTTRKNVHFRHCFCIVLFMHAYFLLSR